MNYLDYEVTQLPDSVEKIFCEPLDAKGVRNKLSDDQMKILITLLQLPSHEIDNMYDTLITEHWLLKVFESRLESIGCKISKASKIMITLLCSSPGEIVMYTYYIAYKMKKENIDELSLKNICSSIFPFGFFSENSLKEYWDKQKVNASSNQGGDNLLDYTKASESLLRK
jgi:hypothetical protein